MSGPSGATVFWVTRVTHDPRPDPAYPYFETLSLYYAPTGWAETACRFAVISKN